MAPIQPEPSASIPQPTEAGENGTEVDWDEERLEKALKSLKEMHIQVGTIEVSTRDSLARKVLIVAAGSRVADYHTSHYCAVSKEATITYVRHSWHST